MELSAASDPEVWPMKWRLAGVSVLAAIGAVAILLWILHVSPVDHWLAVHTGTVNEPGPYYGFWSGFGSDIAEFGILGAIATGVYQTVKKYNCHEPGCWRVGTHPAAAGQFLLCYRHHPDFAGKRPTHDLIERLHRQNAAQQLAFHNSLREMHERLFGHPAAADELPVDHDPRSGQ